MLTTKKPARKDGKAGGHGAGPGGPTSTAHKALITRNLRLAYDEVAGERIPDQMLDLLEQISAREQKGS